MPLLHEIKTMIDDGLLDNRHPAILTVIFITPAMALSMSPSFDDDLFDEETDADLFSTGNL